MHIWTQLGSWLAGRGASRCGLIQPVFTHCDEELPVEPERPWGCGWFDSSLDLRQGLAVIEHPCIDLGLALDMMLMPNTGRH